MSTQTTQPFVVLERTTAVYSATIKDEGGVAIPASSLSALTLTLYAQESGSIINTRDGQDILNANDVTVDEDGLLTWVMQPADNAMSSTTEAGLERHVALFEWSYGPLGAYAGKQEVLIHVRNLQKVP